MQFLWAFAKAQWAFYRGDIELHFEKGITSSCNSISLGNRWRRRQIKYLFFTHARTDTTISPHHFLHKGEKSCRRDIWLEVYALAAATKNTLLILHVGKKSIGSSFIEQDWVWSMTETDYWRKNKPSCSQNVSTYSATSFYLASKRLPRGGGGMVNLWNSCQKHV